MRMKNENVPNALCPQTLKYLEKKKDEWFSLSFRSKGIFHSLSLDL
jgi:hypothetical protein